MYVTATPFFAALLALLYLVLSVRVGRVRTKAKVSIGDGGDMALTRAMRAQANFNEYVPLTLLIIAFLEMRAVSLYVVCILLTLLLVGRILHAIGISPVKEITHCRMFGIIFTFIPLLVGSIWLLVTYL